VAEFAVVDQVDAGVTLAGDHVGDHPAQLAQVLLLVAEVPGWRCSLSAISASGLGRLPAWLVRILSGISPP
jgi:hypothetical protein